MSDSIPLMDGEENDINKTEWDVYPETSAGLADYADENETHTARPANLDRRSEEVPFGS